MKKISELEFAAKLLGVESENIVNQLIQRNIQLRGETVTSPLNLSNSRDVKDAFIKGTNLINYHPLLTPLKKVILNGSTLTINFRQ